MEQELKLSAFWAVLLRVELGKTVIFLTLTEITGIQRQKCSETQSWSFLIQGRTSSLAGFSWRSQAIQPGVLCKKSTLLKTFPLDSPRIKAFPVPARVSVRSCSWDTLENCVSEVLRLLRLPFPPRSLPGLHHQHAQGMSSPLPCWMPPWGAEDTNPFSSLGQSSWRCCLFSTFPVRDLCPGSFSIPPGGNVGECWMWKPLGTSLLPWKRSCIPPGLRPQQDTAALLWDVSFLHNAKPQIWSHLSLSNTHWVMAVRNGFMGLNQGLKKPSFF